MPAIQEVPKEKRTLSELGIEDLTEVVVFDNDTVTELQNLNKVELFNIIGSKFNIRPEEYQAQLPHFDNSGVDPSIDFFNAMPAARGSPSPSKPNLYSSPRNNPMAKNNSGVPPEYANDPDLWYAIQASLGEDVDRAEALFGGDHNDTDSAKANAGYGHNDDGAFDQIMNIDDVASDNHSPKAAMEVAHNVSMDGGSTPKKKQDAGPIFDEAEFGPSGTGPKVQESALVT